MNLNLKNLSPEQKASLEEAKAILGKQFVGSLVLVTTKEDDTLNVSGTLAGSREAVTGITQALPIMYETLDVRYPKPDGMQVQSSVISAYGQDLRRS